MHIVAGVRIEQLVPDALDVLECAIPRAPGVHRDRLAQQDAGGAAYLIAWSAQQPIGQVLARWTGSTRASNRAAVPRAAHLSDLYVVEAHRSRGTRAQLMTVAERAALAHGLARLGLGVDTSNRARALYVRRGFRDAGVPPYVAEYTTVSVDGAPRAVRELVVYMVKDLRENDR